MKYILIAILDQAVGAYQPIVCVRSEGEAIRNFQSAVNNPQHEQLNQHPEDFALDRIGTFEDSTGAITREQPKRLATATQLKLLADGSYPTERK